MLSGDIQLNVGSDLATSLGCNDLTVGKKFTLLPNSGLPVPVKIKTDGGFSILINQLPICAFGQDVISCSQPIDMDLHLIRNLQNPVNK